MHSDIAFSTFGLIPIGKATLIFFVAVKYFDINMRATDLDIVTQS